MPGFHRVAPFLFVLAFWQPLISSPLDSIAPVHLHPAQNRVSISDNSILATSSLSEGALAEYVTFDVWKSKNSFPSNFHCIVGFKLLNTSSVADEWRLKLPGNFTNIYLKKDDGTVDNFTSGTLVSYRDRPSLS